MQCVGHWCVGVCGYVTCRSLVYVCTHACMCGHRWVSSSIALHLALTLVACGFADRPSHPRSPVVSVSLHWGCACLSVCLALARAQELSTQSSSSWDTSAEPLWA